MARQVATTSKLDIITAPATAAGTGAIGIIRLSGLGAIELANRIFSVNLMKVESGKLNLGYLYEISGDRRIDQCLCVVWRNPHSFTGEEMAEFHLHGSSAVMRAALKSCLSAGARLAEPGEFTRRAFLNDKLDLSQAEAVADLSQSQTEEARRAAMAQLSGDLSALMMDIRKSLMAVTAELEASIDYPEEDIPAPSQKRMRETANGALQLMEDLIASYQRGYRFQHGARVVFAGAPNAGKSSLFNAILKRERAIVTPHPGTTRDSLEAVVDLEGIPLTLIDTAGLRANPEEIEALGIQKSREQIQSADLVIFVVDSCVDKNEALEEYKSIQENPHFVIFNKCDLLNKNITLSALSQLFSGEKCSLHLMTSAENKDNIEKLESEIINLIGGKESEGSTPLVLTSTRHHDALLKSCVAVKQAIKGILNRVSPEFIVVDLQQALSEIDAVLGKQQLDEEILDLIFSQFCLGK
jgi:tRNA modification GTPase